MIDDTFDLPWSLARTDEDGHAVVVAGGELDAATAPDLRECMIGGDGDVHVDLGGITFIDSSGLAAIIEAHLHLAAAGRRLLIVERSPAVDRVFQLSGVAGRLNLLAP